MEKWTPYKRLGQVLLKIAAAIHGEWAWHNSGKSKYKYITLRIDMRDGDFIIIDRNGDRIPMSEFKKEVG